MPITVNRKSDTITEIRVDDREIILVGTAHVSKNSVEEVTAIIDENKPDHLCVEIDESRYKSITEGRSWESQSIYKVIKQKKGFLFLANLALSSFQRRMGVDVGTNPGEEMIAAIKKAREMNIPFSFADREVQITLRRAWNKSGFWNKNKLLSVIVGSIFTKEKLSAEDIEKLKNKSALEDMMDEMAKYLPSVKHVLIDERDRFLASKIFNASGKKTVAVVGAGHVNGIISWLEEFYKKNKDTDISEINEIPKPKILQKIIPWLIPVAVLGVIVYGFITAGWDNALDKIWKWIYINGSLSAIGGILALAHPLNIVLAFVLAPITSLNPFIGVGIVCGLVQSVIKKPRVLDFERLNEDILNIKGFYRNRVTHALVVMALISIGSLIGSGIGFVRIL